MADNVLPNPLVRLIDDKQKIETVQISKHQIGIDYEKFMGLKGIKYTLKGSEMVKIQFIIDNKIYELDIHSSLIIDIDPNLENEDEATDNSEVTDKKYTIDDLIKAVIDDNILDITKYCKGVKNINEFDNKHRNAFHYASYLGNVVKMERLFKHKIDFMAADKEGDTALHLAIFADKINAVEYLINRFPGLITKLNVKNQSPLLISAIKNNKFIFLKLFDKNCEIINHQDHHGNSVLHYLADHNNIDILGLFEQRKSETFDISQLKWNVANKTGFTPIHYASLNGHEKFIKFLMAIPQINMEVLLSQMTRENESTIHLALRKHHYSLALDLINKIERKWSKDPISAQYGSILHCAVREKDFTIVEAIVKKDKNLVKVRDSSGETALDLASKMGKTQNTKNINEVLKIVDFLIKHKSK